MDVTKLEEIKNKHPYEVDKEEITKPKKNDIKKIFEGDAITDQIYDPRNKSD